MLLVALHSSTAPHSLAVLQTRVDLPNVPDFVDSAAGTAGASPAHEEEASKEDAEHVQQEEEKRDQGQNTDGVTTGYAPCR